MTILEITLTRGLVGKPASQRRVVEALGLTKYGSSVKHTENAAIRGMVNKVHHLVTVEECSSMDKEKAEKLKAKKASQKKTSGKSAK